MNDILIGLLFVFKACIEIHFYNYPNLTVEHFEVLPSCLQLYAKSMDDCIIIDKTLEK